MKNPEDYDTCRRTSRVSSNGKKYTVLTCRRKDDHTKWEEQSYRYPKDIWTEEQAKTHCEKHNGIKFEPAVNEEKKQTYTCECLECGYILETNKHCRDIKCPKCGGEMRRVERPGPGKEMKQKGVIPYSIHGDGPKAPEDTPWNAAKEVKKASGNAGRLKKMHAWVDSGADGYDPEERQWYKLPHHKGDGNQAVVWKGVAAAMAALLGARGGVDIPDADKKGVYNHLVKHYKQFDKEVPELREYRAKELLELDEKKIIDITGLTKILVVEVEEKVGRVISAKNRKIISDAIAASKNAAAALEKLLEMTEASDNSKDDKKPKKSVGENPKKVEGGSKKGREPRIAHKHTPEELAVHTLKLIAKNTNFALNQVNKTK